MRKRGLGLLLGLLVLSMAPGCRALGVVGAVAGSVAIDWAAASFEEPPQCDHRHSPAPPLHPCR